MTDVSRSPGIVVRAEDAERLLLPRNVTTLLAEGEREQVIQFNPRAALQAAIFADGFVPNSGEFRLPLEATTYAVQRAEHLRRWSMSARHTVRNIARAVLLPIRLAHFDDPAYFARVHCPICRTEHEWFAKEAWVCDAEPRPQRKAVL